MTEEIIKHPVADANRKVDALQAVLMGEDLTETQKASVRSILDDISPLVQIGNTKAICRVHVIEAFRILIQEVPLMVGERRRKAIVLLHEVGARGFQTTKELHEIPQLLSESMAERLHMDIDEEEIAEAVFG